MHRLAGIAIAALLLGCRGQESRDHKPSADAAPTVTNTAVPPGSTSDLGLGDSDCPVDTATVHTDPAALLREFAARDTSGTTYDDRWLWGALTCVELITSDWLAVVTDYSLTPVRTTRDSSTAVLSFKVRYSLGYDSNGTVPRLITDERTVTETAVVLRTKRGWRINAITPGSHLSPAAALIRLRKLTAADRARLDSLKSPPGA